MTAAHDLSAAGGELPDDELRAWLVERITLALDTVRVDKGEYYNPQLLSERAANQIHGRYAEALRTARAERNQAQALLRRMSRPFDLMSAQRCQTRCNPPFHTPGCTQRTALSEEIHASLATEEGADRG